MKRVRFKPDKPDTGAVAGVLDVGVLVLIVLSTFTTTLSTVHDFASRFPRELDFLEMVFTCCFTLEILARVWAAESCASYFKQVSSLVDITATVPWYVEKALDRLAWAQGSHSLVKIAGSMRTLRMVWLVRAVRLLRVLRLAKAARHSEMISIVLESTADSLEGISILVFMVGMGSVVPATILYALESEEEGGNFASIPSSMWWSMATITTVGYGDVVPSTAVGKAVAGGTMVIGTVIMSVSMAAITTRFVESYRKRTVVARIAKRMRKAKTVAAMPTASEDDDAVGDHGELLPALTRSNSLNFPLRQGGERPELVVVFAVLERDMKAAMARLERAVREQACSLEGGGSACPRGPPGSAGVLLPKANPFLTTLRILQGQIQAVLKSAMTLAEHLSEAEPNSSGPACSHVS